MKCGHGAKLSVRRKEEASSANKGSPTKGGYAREVYFELYPVGESIKVSAVDGDTGVEVSIVGPSKLPQAELERVALNKLNYVMKQKAAGSGPSDIDRKPVSDGKGWVV
jgi:hypothetical protein